MTKEYFYNKLREEFKRLIELNGLNAQTVSVGCRLLSPNEAIGITERKDFPILTGKEIMLSAELQGELGQAFTDAPSAGKASLSEIINADILENQHDLSVFIASLNAVMKKLGLTDRTVHCKNDEPEICAGKISDYIKSCYGNPKIALIGYQPAMLEKLSGDFSVRVLDLNDENIGEKRYGVTVENGIDAYASAVEWADLILCTGSTVCNGSIVNFIDIGKEVLFFGTTLSGAARLMNLKRICFCAH
ncbi:MAG: DUF364 domain-containing protein [Oscillospiraceae bacterium]